MTMNCKKRRISGLAVWAICLAGTSACSDPLKIPIPESSDRGADRPNAYGDAPESEVEEIVLENDLPEEVKRWLNDEKQPLKAKLQALAEVVHDSSHPTEVRRMALDEMVILIESEKENLRQFDYLQAMAEISRVAQGENISDVLKSYAQAMIDYRIEQEDTREILERFGKHWERAWSGPRITSEEDRDYYRALGTSVERRNHLLQITALFKVRYGVEVQIGKSKKNNRFFEESPIKAYFQVVEIENALISNIQQGEPAEKDSLYERLDLNDLFEGDLVIEVFTDPYRMDSIDIEDNKIVIDNYPMFSDYERVEATKIRRHIEDFVKDLNLTTQ